MSGYPGLAFLKSTNIFSMDESIIKQLDEQTLMLKEILRRLSILESTQASSTVNNTPPPQSNSFALAHLRSLGEVF
jgi:hypothetical protein